MTDTLSVSAETFAHVARAMLCTAHSITLLELSPSTIRMSTAPSPHLGYLPTGAYLDLWAAMERRTRVRRPWSAQGNLALLGADAELPGAALLLRNPRVTTSGLTYDADVVEGFLPARSGACVLFVRWRAVVRPARA